MWSMQIIIEADDYEHKAHGETDLQVPVVDDTSDDEHDIAETIMLDELDEEVDHHI